MIGVITRKDKRVPRVNDKKLERYIPVENIRKANTLLLTVEFLQSARQKSDTPIKANENGIELPENNLTLSVLNFWK